MAARKNPHAVALGRQGGRATSAAKTRANRLNAQRAGRRPKFGAGDRVLGRDTAPACFRDRAGFVVARGPGRAEYQIAFDDGRTEHVMSWWIDRAARA